MRSVRLTSGRVLSGALLLLAVGCSHEEPYIRGELHPADPPAPVPSDIAQRLILIGDAGAPSVNGEPVLVALREAASTIPERTLVVFLGDNIYPNGLPADGAPDRDAAERALEAQLAAAGPARALFLPGNHDWGDAQREGPAALERLATWLSAYPNAGLLPRAGCGGPAAIDLDGLRLVALDTEWWFQTGAKGDRCRAKDTRGVEAGLRQAITPDDGRPVVVLGHHPLRSRGPHGGFFTWEEWLRPSTERARPWPWVGIPLPGRRPFRRRMDRHPQDLASEEYRFLTERLSQTLASNPPLAYASGHEHSLQVFEGGDAATLLLVSGAGSAGNATPVGHDAQTLFAHEHAGFMMLDVLGNRALLRVVEPGVEPGTKGIPYWRELDLR